MALSDCLQKFFNLPEQKAFAEAPSKLQGSFMKINGILLRIDSIDKDGIVWYDAKTDIKGSTVSKDVKTLTAFLPDSGVYFTKKGFPFVLFRKPLRQWHKSYYDNLYQVLRPIPHQESVLDIVEDSRQEIWVDQKENIWHWSVQIGKIVNKKLFCTNPHFKQELIDWSKHARTT